MMDTLERTTKYLTKDMFIPLKNTNLMKTLIMILHKNL